MPTALNPTTAATLALPDPAASGVLLDELTAANLPAQLPLVTKLASLLALSPAVTHLLVRGSLASGTADRLSDLDFVVGVQDAALPAFAAVLDDLMRVAAGALLPGWPDTIVADLGGLGFVFLVPDGGKLQQIDLYLAPASAVEGIRRSTATAVLLERPGPAASEQDRQVAAGFVAARSRRSPSCTDLLIEHLVLAVLLHKRLRRGQLFVAYDEWHRFHTATKNLVKAALAPASRFWGWYQLREEIGITPIGRAALADLEVFVHTSAVPDAAQVDQGLEWVLELAERACPHAFDGLADAVAAYRTYQELA